MSTPIKVGALAPEFKAKAYVAGQFKDVGLKDFQGKWVCLFFYPLDFTFVCPTEIIFSRRDLRRQFERNSTIP